MNAGTWNYSSPKISPDAPLLASVEPVRKRTVPNLNQVVMLVFTDTLLLRYIIFCVDVITLCWKWPTSPLILWWHQSWQCQSALHVSLTTTVGSEHQLTVNRLSCSLQCYRDDVDQALQAWLTVSVNSAHYALKLPDTLFAYLFRAGNLSTGLSLRLSQ